MAFNAGNAIERKKFTGLAKLQVVAINPTLAELHEMGVNMKNEPEYLTHTEAGEVELKVDFWLKHDSQPILSSLRFYLVDKLSVARSGNKEYINDFGSSAYGASIDVIASRNQPWFDIDTLRQAYEGETDLVSFIRNWLCVPQNSVANIDSWDALFQGNITEITDMMKLTPDGEGTKYKVQVLLFVNDNGYQAIYNRFFGRMDSGNIKRWKTHFENSTSTVNYGGDFNLKEMGESVTPSSAPTTPTEGNAPW